MSKRHLTSPNSGSNSSSSLPEALITRGVLPEKQENAQKRKTSRDQTLLQAIRIIPVLSGFCLCTLSTRAFADFHSLEAQKQAFNLPAVLIFTFFVLITLLLTGWAAKYSRSRKAFYTAGGGIPAWQNGIAISGDFLSAATFLGITASLFFQGIDGLLLIGSTLVAWPLVLLLISERLRNLGRFTFIDVLSFRLQSNKIRALAALASLFVLIFYLIGQLVGAGKLIQTLFGLHYEIAIITVSLLMVIYILFGGMLAATWVQFIKTILLIAGGTLLTFLILSRFNFNLEKLFLQAVEVSPRGEQLMEVGGWLKNPVSVFSTGLTLIFGFIGLPHILMRLFTVKDAKASRKSAFYAISIIGFFQLMIILIGFGAVALIVNNPEYHTATGELIGGRNMVVLHVTHFLGGNLLLGFIAAVTFATILAVVSGLTISAAATISHDLYACTFAREQRSEKREMFISKLAIIGMGVLAVFFGLLFEKQNVVFITNLAMAIAASANAPVLLAALYWPNLTSRGAIAGISVGLASSVILLFLGPQIWEEVLKLGPPVFPYTYPTILSVPCAFLALYIFSKTDRSERGKQEKAAFLPQQIQSETGRRKEPAIES